MNARKAGASSLRRKFAWTLAGSSAFAVSQFALIVVIAKVGSPELAGDWTLALSITGPAFIFFQFKLRAIQATDARDENVWGDYLTVRIAGMAAAFVLVTLIAVLGYRDATIVAILAVGLTKALDGLAEVVYGQEQRHERMERIARSQLGRGISALVLGGVAAWQTQSAAWIAGGISIAYLGWLVRDLMLLTRRPENVDWSPRWRPGPLKKLFRRAVPLGMVTALGSLQVNVPRYFLEGYASRAELGVFGTLSYLLIVGSLVIAAVAHTALPRMSRQAADAQWREFARYLRNLVAIGATLGLAAVGASMLLGEQVLRVVYSDEYARHWDVLVWMSLASGLSWSYVFLGTALDAMRRFEVQPWIHLLSTSVIVVASFLLIPPHGMKGAAWALVCGYATEGVLYSLCVVVPLRREVAALSVSDEANRTQTSDP